MQLHEHAPGRLFRALTFVMHDACIGHMHDFPPRLLDAAAPVHFLAIHEELFVKPPHGSARFAPHHHACAEGIVHRKGFLMQGKWVASVQPRVEQAMV